MVLLWLCVLCGVPGAGKTTLAARLGASSAELASFERPPGAGGRDVVCTLEYDAMAPDAFSGDSWKRARRSALDTAQRMFALAGEDSSRSPQDLVEREGGLSAGEGRFFGASVAQVEPLLVVILDDNHMYRSMRKGLASFARRYRAVFTVVLLQSPPLEDCIARRAGVLPAAVVADAYAKLEPPREDPWERDWVGLTSGASWHDLRGLYDRARARAADAIVAPSAAPLDPAAVPAPSHQAEIELRRAVGQLIRQGDWRAQQIVEAKRRLVQADVHRVVARSTEEPAERFSRLLIALTDELSGARGPVDTAPHRREI